MTWTPVAPWRRGTRRGRSSPDRRGRAHRRAAPPGPSRSRAEPTRPRRAGARRSQDLDSRRRRSGQGEEVAGFGVRRPRRGDPCVPVHHEVDRELLAPYVDSPQCVGAGHRPPVRRERLPQGCQVVGRREPEARVGEDELGVFVGELVHSQRIEPWPAAVTRTVCMLSHSRTPGPSGKHTPDGDDQRDDDGRVDEDGRGGRHAAGQCLRIVTLRKLSLQNAFWLPIFCQVMSQIRRRDAPGLANAHARRNDDGAPPASRSSADLRQHRRGPRHRRAAESPPRAACRPDQ